MIQPAQLVLSCKKPRTRYGRGFFLINICDLLELAKTQKTHSQLFKESVFTSKAAFGNYRRYLVKRGMLKISKFNVHKKLTQGQKPYKIIYTITPKGEQFLELVGTEEHFSRIYPSK